MKLRWPPWRELVTKKCFIWMSRSRFQRKYFLTDSVVFNLIRSSWERISRKDGKDLWRTCPDYYKEMDKRDRKRQHEEQNGHSPVPSKVARTDSDSSFRPRETSSRIPRKAPTEIIDLDSGTVCNNFAFRSLF